MSARRKKKFQLNYASAIIAIIGIVLLNYSLSFASSCENPAFAADKSQHIFGLQCTIAFSDVIFLLGISIIVLVVGLATLKK